MQSTNSHHALGGSNRKFYWNSIENYFEPIVYDANPDISRDFSTTTTSKIRYPVSAFYDEAIKNLNQKLSSINNKSLKNQISYLGLSLSEDSINKKINKIKENLKLISQNYNKIKQEGLTLHNQYKYKENILEQFNKNLKEIDPQAYLIKNENDKLLKCEIYFENCQFYNISKTNLIKLLEGELEIKNINYQYVGNDIDLKNLSQKENYLSLKFLNSTIFYEEGIKIEADQNKNEIIINQEEIGSRAFILNGDLKDTSITFNGVETFNNEKPRNYQLMPRV